MNPIGSLRRWWQDWTGEDETPFDGDTPAWAVSLAFHLGVLVLLTVIWQYNPADDVMLTVTPLDTQEELETVPEEFTYSNNPQVEIGSDSLAGAESALALASTIDEISRLEKVLQPTDVATVSELVLDNFSTAPTMSENLLVKGAVGVGATGANGAVDRITQEIIDSLEERRTLVVWLFDQSGSMQAQRASISSRFNRIYEELNLLGSSGSEAFTKHGDEPLLTSVMAFGEKVTFRTKEPTDDLNEIKSAVEGIENDASGIEMVFNAVGMAAKKYQTFRTQAPRRNVMFVVVSDEVGDDEVQMESALSLCRRHEIPVYCIGVPAPFARTEIEVKYVDPDPNFDQSVQWIPVRQGPESVYPEGVRLGFAGNRHQDLDHMDSGFGPFALTRLCYETGGIYFAVHPNREGGGRRRRGGGDPDVMSARLDHFFDPAIMRNYQPDYVSIKEYEQRLQQNKARAALVQAARMSLINPMENPRLEFPKVDEGALKRSLDEAQQVAAKIGPKLDALYQLLKQGEKDRAKLTAPRWQAGYDLALGRVIAIKVRTESYNAMLAKAKGGLKFEKPESDTYVLVPADEISVGSALEKLAKQAREYLERVKKEHPGTPWALLAEEELKEPIGWKWSEKVTNVGRERMPMGDAGPANNTPEGLNKMAKPKPRREGVKL